MNLIEICWYNYYTKGYGRDLVNAFSLHEVIDIIREMYNYKIFVYHAEYFNIAEAIKNL